MADDTRIGAAMPTIAHLLEPVRAVVLMRRTWGGPRGEPDQSPAAGGCASRTARSPGGSPSCVGPPDAVADSERRGSLLLENLRFHPEEEANDPAFARELAALPTST